MTESERIETLLRHRKPDRVPIWPFGSGGFSCVDTGHTLVEFYTNPALALEVERVTCRKYGWVFSPMYTYAAYGGWEFGGDIKWPSCKFDQAPSIKRYPVETELDVWDLSKPDIAGAGYHPLLTEFNRLASAEKLDNEPFNACIPLLGSFSVAGNIAGPERPNRWLLKKPDVAHHLLKAVTDYEIEVARYWKNMFGTEHAIIHSGEALASNQVISPKHFEQFVLPYLRQLYQSLHSLGYKNIHTHICGDQNANLPFWSQVPLGDPGIISIGHEVDILTAANYFPEHIILGNIEPAIIQTRSPQEVYEASRIVIEKGKTCAGGFIFSSGCQLPPMSSSKNVRMMTKAVCDFGWY